MPEQTAKKKSFKDTLNLPKTAFAMKANLVQNEPASIKRWKQQKLYEQLRRREHPRGRYVFHDGPPYANGSIHLGHLLNKVLKDIVVRSKSMAGFDCPYVPGWDCHGLPIEHKVMQERQSDGATKRRSDEGSEREADAHGSQSVGSEAMSIRRDCRKYAQKYVKLQSEQMQRLLTVADYEMSDDPLRGPYLTMTPAYEAAVLEVFAALVGRGLVYRKKKPVHWSIDNRTALADAELEYEDREDVSVYVTFEVTDPTKLPAAMNMPAGRVAHLMIWTTTPWTLPANLAVAVHEKFEYGLYRLAGKGEFDYVVLATALANSVFSAAGFDGVELLGVCTGVELVGLTYKHPFIHDRADRPVVAADYVTLEDGTGLVHTAPGHGVEDYQTGLREGLDIYCPVQEDGTFDATAPDWLRGQSVWKANDLVVEHLRQSGHLFHSHTFTHSYPHDWRSKGPVIFRATEQWFVDVGKVFAIEESDGATEPRSHEGEETASLRDRALAVTAKDVRFFPEWGRNRMRGMLESRPDWCISRQRAWGLPIPAFFGPEKGQVLLTRASVAAVADVVRKHGSDCWFRMEAHELLADYDAASDPDVPEWMKSEIRNPKSEIRKASDIFDVWFESGSSWNAVMRQRGLARPDDAPAVTDLYLEGSDQHRGWFQLSLLPCLGVLGKSPFAAVLTHGFLVDKDGHKLAKSKGHTIEGLFKEFGADVLRWWVSGQNTDNDIKVDDEFFRHAGEEYRKVRNTLRFILGTLADFDMERDKVRFEDADAASIDAWATRELIRLSDAVTGAYRGFEFRKAHTALFNFCNETMSAVYLAAVKDRLYCDAPNSPRRRRTQTTLYRVATTLIRLLAPILPHTADEAWRALEGEDAPCVHLKLFQDVECMRQVPVNEQWVAVMDARDAWLKALETFRRSAGVDNPLDCGIAAPSPKGVSLEAFDPTDLADLCGVSRFTVSHGDAIAAADLRNEPRCERSWKRDGTVKQRGEGGEGDDAAMLSDRDAAAMGLA